MPIVGFHFDKILVEKKGPIQGSIQVKNDLGIFNIEKQQFSLGKKESGLKFNFEFKAEYEPKLGSISLKGHILFMDKKASLDKILDNWKKNKQIEPKLMQTLLNTVLVKCNIKALMLANEVNLPPHLQLPLLKATEDLTKKKNKAEEYVV